MRLLECKTPGMFSLTNDFIGDDIPQYAILSHTWGADAEEEVTFNDLIKGTGKSKAGYRKICFCGEQAALDGLQHFWVDTCCIDKTNSVELHEAIRSMFRWYRNAAKCYAYLSDVSRPDSSDRFNQQSWKLAFRKSRWFTRGWTLQELVAPASVEFFSNEWEKLGSKKSLEILIHEITGIPVRALQGSPLDNFSPEERMSWAEKRETKRKEDMAYSLLGIFDIHMSLIYSEGRDKALERLWRKIRKASKEKGDKYKDFSIPFSLSSVSEIEHFVARDDELVEMHQTLSGDGSRRTVVLHGLGGMGKTQLAIAYAKKNKDNYTAIFWLNMRDENSLNQSFANLASQISQAHPSASRLSNVDAVKAWLSLPENTRWLIVYDNYDNPKLPGGTDPAALDINKFLPKSQQGSIIITTRSSQVRIGHLIRIQKLGDVRDSLEILSNASRREGLINDPDAVRLAKELDGLPLALATAGAYLHQVTTSFSEYLRLDKASWAELQKASPKLDSYDRMLCSTWQPSFDCVKKTNKLSARLLRLWAYFDNRDIWYKLLRRKGPGYPAWIRELTKDELSFNSAVRVLSDHGLVEIDTSTQELVDGGGYSIHGCVHSWTIHVLNKEWDHGLAKLALKLVGSYVPKDTGKWWLRQQRLLRHATRCSYNLSNGLVSDDGMAWECHNLGRLYVSEGELDEAEKMYLRALEGYKKERGPTEDTLNNLGLLYATKGELGKAEERYEQAMEVKLTVWGEDHKSTLDTINNLGALYVDQRKLDEAEKMYQRALRGKEEAYGPDHESTMETVNNLGALYAHQRKLDMAEEMYLRALKGKEMALDPHHPSILDTVNNLGLLYAKQNKSDKAEEMYRKALRGYEKAQGPAHIITIPELETTQNLADLLSQIGKLGEAKELYLRTQRRTEEGFGRSSKQYREITAALADLGTDES